MQEHPLSALDGRSTARLRRSACVWQTNIPAAHAARAMSGYDKRCESSKGRLLPVMWAVRIRLHPSVPAEVRASRREKGLGQALARAINNLLMPSMRQFTGTSIPFHTFRCSGWPQRKCSVRGEKHWANSAHDEGARNINGGHFGRCRTVSGTVYSRTSSCRMEDVMRSYVSRHV